MPKDRSTLIVWYAIALAAMLFCVVLGLLIGVRVGP